MAHPKMYADDDPYLAELRERALAVPEAVEVEAPRRPWTGGRVRRRRGRA